MVYIERINLLIDTLCKIFEAKELALVDKVVLEKAKEVILDYLCLELAMPIPEKREEIK